MRHDDQRIWRFAPDAGGVPVTVGDPLVRYADLHADATRHRIVALAEQNAAIRPNGEAKVLLAKAYWRANRLTDARRVLNDVLHTKWRTPELDTFAAVLRRAING